MEYSSFTGFEPVVSPRSRILILGTMPSPASVREGFYYGHPQNRFWKVLAQLLEYPAPESVTQKKALLAACHIALWDVLASCERVAASDTSIKNEISNDIAGFIRENDGIRLIACNGAKSYEMYTRHAASHIPKDIRVLKLPSTSPANASFPLARLCESWRQIFEELE